MFSSEFLLIEISGLDFTGQALLAHCRKKKIWSIKVG